MQNPYAKDAASVAVYYNDDGVLEYIVHADGDNFSPHAFPRLHRFIIKYGTFHNKPPENIGGVARYLKLDRAMVAEIAKTNPGLASKVEARVLEAEKARGRP